MDQGRLILIALLALILGQAAQGVMLLFVISRMRSYHMDEQSAVTDLTDEVSQLEADEVTEKESLGKIIADFDDFKNNVNTTQTLEDLVTRLKTLHAANVADTAAVDAADPATPATPVTPEAPAAE